MIHIAIISVALSGAYDDSGVYADTECLSPSTSVDFVTTGDVTVGGDLSCGGTVSLDDSQSLTFGDDGASDTAVYFDGTDWFLTCTECTTTSGGVMLGLAPTAPAPDGRMLHIWKSSPAGSLSCNDSTDTICLENNGNSYLRFLTSTAALAAFVAGDTSNASYAGIYFGMSANPSRPGQILFTTAGATTALEMEIGLMNHTQATTYSTDAGDLTFDPAGDIAQGPDTVVTTTYGSRNGFAGTCGGQGEETLTFAGGAGDASKTTSGLIPQGATNIVVAARVLTAGTTCTSADYGDGTVVDLYGDNVAVAANTTVGPADYTATINYNATAASDVTITGVGGNCVDMVVRVVAYYCTWTSPTD